MLLLNVVGFFSLSVVRLVSGCVVGCCDICLMYDACKCRCVEVSGSSRVGVVFAVFCIICSFC